MRPLRIAAFVLSDLHLGASQGLLLDANDPTPAGEAPLAALVECLRAIAGDDRPELILAGDAVEMALRPAPVAFNSFRRFLDLIYGSSDIVDRKVTYLPGNHDHHLWELTRQSRWLDELHHAAPVTSAQYSTELSTAPGELAGLSAMIDPDGPLGGVELRVVYPNAARVTDDGTRGVVIHHGHLVEPLYGAMSVIDEAVFGRKEYSTVEAFERDNHAWIDFLWSALGTSGEVGHDLGTAYHMLPDGAAMRATAGRMADRLAAHERNHVTRAAKRVALRLLFGGALFVEHALETRRPHASLSPAAERGVTHYLEGLLRRQIDEQLSVDPDALSFVFGHTHKPFQRIWPAEGYAQPVAVHNTGGWVNESQTPQPTQGAQVVVLGDDLSVVSIELFRQDPDGGSTPARVRSPLVDDEGHRALHAELSRRVASVGQPFRDLRSEISRMLDRRRAELVALGHDLRHG